MMKRRNGEGENGDARCREIGNGEWEIGNGEWEMGNGEWRVGNGFTDPGGSKAW